MVRRIWACSEKKYPLVMNDSSIHDIDMTFLNLKHRPKTFPRFTASTPFLPTTPPHTSLIGWVMARLCLAVWPPYPGFVSFHVAEAVPVPPHKQCQLIGMI